jgi:hypothetical protein
MTVSTTTRKAGPYTGNDVTATFPFEFKVFSDTDVVVVRTDLAGVESTLTLHDDYSVALNPDQDVEPGGSITLPAPLEQDYLCTLTSDVPILQPLVLTNQGGFHPDVINKALDRLTVQSQQLAEQLSRSIKLGISDPTPADEYRDALLQSAADAIAAAAAAASSASESAQTASASALSALEAAAFAASANPQLLSSNHFGPTPPAITWPGMTWADSGTNTFWRRDEDNLEWIDEGRLFSAPVYADEARWLGTPIGVPFPLWDHIPGCPIPLTDNPRFRYIKLTASDAYNSGVLVGESVSGSSPTIVATGIVNLPDSPIHGQTIPLINTSQPFLRPSTTPGVIVAGQNEAHPHSVTLPRYVDGQSGNTGWSAGQTLVSSSYVVNTSTSGGNEARPRYLGASFYMRAL